MNQPQIKNIPMYGDDVNIDEVDAMHSSKNIQNCKCDDADINNGFGANGAKLSEDVDDINYNDIDEDDLIHASDHGTNYAIDIDVERDENDYKNLQETNYDNSEDVFSWVEDDPMIIPKNKDLPPIRGCGYKVKYNNYRQTPFVTDEQMMYDNENGYEYEDSVMLPEDGVMAEHFDVGTYVVTHFFLLIVAFLVAFYVMHDLPQSDMMRGILVALLIFLFPHIYLIVSMVLIILAMLKRA